MQDIKIDYGNANKAQDIKYNIVLVEQKIGAVLPMEYKEFIKKYNGGSPELNTYVPINASDKNDERIVAFFFNYGDDFFEAENIFSVINTVNIPNITKYCPIAEDPFGNLMLISLDEEFYGHILCADHENSYFATVIADSFTDFINMLYVSVEVM